MNGLQGAWRGVRQALESAQVTFAIGGSWASAAYGEPRQTNDIDVVAGFDEENLKAFLGSLGPDFYFDVDTAIQALAVRRPFNVIHKQLAYKFDFFPARDEHDAAELERHQVVLIAGLDEEPVPVVTAEDIVLAKLRWYRLGGNSSEQQWRDILSVLRGEAGRLDEAYLERWAGSLGLLESYQKARSEAGW